MVEHHSIHHTTQEWSAAGYTQSEQDLKGNTSGYATGESPLMRLQSKIFVLTCAQLTALVVIGTEIIHMHHEAVHKVEKDPANCLKSTGCESSHSCCQDTAQPESPNEAAEPCVSLDSGHPYGTKFIPIADLEKTVRERFDYEIQQRLLRCGGDKGGPKDWGYVVTRTVEGTNAVT